MSDTQASSNPSTEKPKQPLVQSIFDLTPDALGQLKLWLEQAGINVPVSQLVGFLQFVPVSSLAAGSVSTTSSTYASLSGGPTLSGLADGQYLLLYGAWSNPSSSQPLYGSPSINGATPDDNVAFTVSTGASTSIMSATTATVSGSKPNTVELKYKSTGGATSGFSRRFLIAIRYSNA